MAREVVTNIWCDLCLDIDDDEAVYTPATELPPIAFTPTMKPRVLALCEAHRKEWYDPFKELLTNLGVVAEPGTPAATRMPGASPGSGTYPCPVPTCPKHTRPLKHEQSLRNHARNVHGSTVSELKAEHGEAPVPEKDLFTPPDEVKPPTVTRAECDVPGCDNGPDGGPTVYEWPAYQKPVQALGVHKAKKHGVMGATKRSARRANGKG